MPPSDSFSMTPEEWSKVERIFHDALERPTTERTAFLDGACGGDSALRQHVESLIQHAGRTEMPVTPQFQQEVSAAFPFEELIAEPPSQTKEPAHYLVPDTHLVLAAGTKLGPYEILSCIGAGGMGEVYRSRDTRLRRTVAIKTLSSDAINDPDRRRRFLQEARAASALSHPNIVTLHDIGTERGIDFFVMEYVPETPLDRLISSNGMPLDDVLEYGIQIANALAAAHAAGIIHRDIKPGNVMVTPQRQVKVLDFGLAKAPQIRSIGPDSETRTANVCSTKTGQVMGTVAYMSPEQARSEVLDARTDLFSFGAVLYEMLAGQRAFPNEWDWSPPPAEGIDPLLYRIILKLIEVDREQRYASAVEVAEDLKRAQQRLQSRSRRGLVIISAAAALLLLAAGVRFFNSAKPPVTSPSEYTQITNFTDSVSAPALSPDGRMVTFKRGGDFFLSTGQIYVKLLPNGESVRLTNDDSEKYGPVFTPDDSRIAYTRLAHTGGHTSWDTWTVPVIGGEPSELLPNASGLTWINDLQILFSEFRGAGIHMGVVTANETRGQSRTIYFPAHEVGMAHYSHLSPDRKSILVVEMGPTHSWDSPCRLLPFDGSSMGRQVGPQGKCLSAAWSPDGKWMYFGADVGGDTHLWRQKFPDGTPEQITFGATQEEGIAVAPDGQSLITSVGRRLSAIWIHDAAGERPITSEGYASVPTLARDGKTLFYLDSGVSAAFSAVGPTPVGELRRVDLTSGKSDVLLPGMPVLDYDISRDDKDVVFTTVSNGEPQIWIAPLDRRAAPRKITQPGDQVSFGSGAELVFRVREKQLNFLYRVRSDGNGRERIGSSPILYKWGISPDGEWVTASVPSGATASADNVSVPFETVAIPVHGGQPKNICGGGCSTIWSSNGKFVYTEHGTGWLAIPLAAGQMLPNLNDAGIDPRVKTISLDASGKRLGAGPDPSTYAFEKIEIRSNLFRIPLH